MDLKVKRKEIRKKYFSIQGLAAVSILGGVGLLFLFFSGIFGVKSIDMLYDCVYQNGITIIFGGFFLSVSLYCWLVFFLNIIIKPKKEVLYLYRNEYNEVYFISRKGKRFICDKDNLKEGCYYCVLKTHHYIYEVLEEVNDNWNPIEKKSYWLNFYSPIGNFEDMILLPIAYVILLLSVLSFFMSEGYGKIFGLIWCVIPIYIIGYDLIYKIKLKKSNYEGINDEKFYKSYEILKNIMSVIAAVLLCIILMTIFFKLSDFISRLVFSPFLGCGLCSAGLVLAKVFKNKKLEKIFSKGYIIIFLIYWFGFLSFWTVGVFKQKGSILYVLFSIPFWIAGLFIIDLLRN